MKAMKSLGKTKEIPHELQLEILSWLPSKSLARFNCVCKLWNDSFTSTAFLLHHSRSRPRNRFCLHRSIFIEVPSKHPVNNNNNDVSTPKVKGYKVSLRNLPSKFLWSGTYIGSSNINDGLICLFTSRRYIPNFTGRHDLSNLSMLLFSLRTKAILILPTISDEDKQFGLMNGNVRRLVFCSLGFDPMRKDYKLLRIVMGFGVSLRYEILTVGAKSWKLVDQDRVPPLLVRPCLPSEDSFCLDGVMYWLHNQVLYGRTCVIIASFDLVHEEFRAFELDQLVGSTHKSFYDQYYLTPLNGCPTLLYRMKNDETICQWTLSDYTNAVWTPKMVTFNTDTAIWPYDHAMYVGGSIVLQRLFECDSWTYYCYDHETGNYWFIEIEEEGERFQVRNIGAALGLRAYASLVA